MEKECPSCKVIKPMSGYYRRTRKKQYPGHAGYSTTCMECVKETSREFTKNNPDKVGFAARRYQLLRDYDMTVEDYNGMFSKQDGCCAVCKKHNSELQKGLAVDHCHETGEIRGLLCGNCNMALGCAQDNKNVLKALINYLENYPGLAAKTNIAEISLLKKEG